MATFAGASDCYAAWVIRVRDGETEAVLSMEEFEARARRGVLSPHALVSLPALTGDTFVEARSLPMFAAVYDPRRLLFRRHFHLGRLPIVTGAVALVCVLLWFVARDLGDGAVTREALLVLGAKARARVLDEGETWRLLMASLLHKDGVHLGFNLFVLVAVGAVLEGVYRRGDYLLLLVAGGLACMTTSLLMSPPATVGASGMVFACLGCAMIFGLRFADVLPLRYRLYFGVVVVIYTAAAFWSGLLRTSTDNWGHAGGLVAGAVCGLVFEPRLLRLSQVRERPLVTLQPWLTVVGLVVVVVAAGPLVPRLMQGTLALPFPAFGVVLEHPRSWTRSPNPLGFVAVGNGTDALASLACTRARDDDDAPPPELAAMTRRFVDGELFGLSRSGHIANLEVDADDTALVDGVPARRVDFAFVASDGPFSARAFVFVRGRIECVLVTAARTDASPRARVLLDELAKHVRLVPTEAERTAVARTAHTPGSTKLWLERARAHADAAALDEARAAFDKATALADDEPSWIPRVGVARARFELALGHDLEAAAAAAARAVKKAPGDADATAAAIDTAFARGHREAACIDRLGARGRFPDDARFAPSRGCAQ